MKESGYFELFDAYLRNYTASRPTTP